MMTVLHATAALEQAQRALDKINVAIIEVKQAQHELRDILHNIPGLDIRPHPDELEMVGNQLRAYYWGFQIGIQKEKQK